MPNHPNNEQERISTLIAEALTSEGAESAAEPSVGAELASIPDPKRLFCDNWDTVKLVLGVLRQFAPAFLKPLIDLVIKAGDALKGAICR